MSGLVSGVTRSFGDGAGAVVLEPTGPAPPGREQGLLAFQDHLLAHQHFLHVFQAELLLNFASQLALVLFL